MKRSFVDNVQAFRCMKYTTLEFETNMVKELSNKTNLSATRWALIYMYKNYLKEEACFQKKLSFSFFASVKGMITQNESLVL
jgi:hypothetical protein